MHDDLSLTIGRVGRVLRERVWPAVYAVSAPLTIQVHALEGEPIPVSDGLALDFTDHVVGTGWGPAWGTTWFRLTGPVPDAFAGRRVDAILDLGFDPNLTGFQCEGLVYTPDGRPIKSLNPRNSWVTVTDHATGGETVELFVEAASNPTLLGYEPFVPTEEGDIRTSDPRPLYVTRRMDLAVFDAEVFELALDLEVLLELQAELGMGPRRMQILQALDNALDQLDLRAISGTAAAARAELADVLARPAEPSAHRVTAIGHAHIDSAWLWPVRETVRKVARTSASMISLLESDEDFVYGMSSAQQYAWLKTYRPEVYALVKEAVAAGRFVPLGGMWVESDTVMPSGESLVRQFLYGQRFFEEEFGIRCQGVWLPDSFGYSPALPQLIRRAGFSWFFTQKISWNQVNVFPHHTFAWEGIDGSRVLSHFPSMDTYNSQLSGAELAKASRQFRESRRTAESIAPVGWGDGGGGTTREMAGKARRTADLEGSPRVRWELPDAFFERAAAALPDPPVWVGELYLELHRGTLTSQHRTKQGNRRAEHLLVEAELWAATATLRTGADYPYDALDAAWQQVLLNQFHDILPGTSIAWVHREAVEQYQGVLGAADTLIDDALAALSGPGERTLTANGSAFDVDGVEPGAARTAAATTGGAVSVTPEAGGFVVDNGVVRLVLSSEGLLRSAVDLASGREAIAPGRDALLLQLHQDFPNMWDAWDVDRYYRNRVHDVRDVDAMSAQLVDGVATISIQRPLGAASSVRQILRLAPGSRHLEIEQETDWHEVETLLKLAFPLDLKAAHTAAETQFGFQQRVTHTNTSWEAAKFETSMHRFVYLEEPGFGVAVVNDSSYGYDVSRETAGDGIATTVRMSLLRSPRFPDPRTDQGLHRHRFGLLIGTDLGEATRHGAVLNTPVRRYQGGSAVEPIVGVDGPGVVLSSVKLAADRSGDIVVRLYEALGARTVAAIRFDVPVAEVWGVSLLEEPLPDSVLECRDGIVAVPLSGFQVFTVRARPAAR